MLYGKNVILQEHIATYWWNQVSVYLFLLFLNFWPLTFHWQVMKVIDNVRPDRQTVMFSATFPRQMEALARRILTKPTEVQVGGRSVVCKEVTQHVVSWLTVKPLLIRGCLIQKKDKFVHIFKYRQFALFVIVNKTMLIGMHCN